MSQLPYLYLDFGATILVLYGLWLNARQHVGTWPVWIFASVMWIIHWIWVWSQGESFQTAATIMHIILMCFYVYGWVRWVKTATARVSQTIIKTGGHKLFIDDIDDGL